MRIKTSLLSVFFLVTIITFLISGCATVGTTDSKPNLLLPSSEEIVVSAWKSSEDFQKTIEKTEIGQNIEQYKNNGIDPNGRLSPNIEIVTNIEKILNYVGVNEELMRYGLIDIKRIHPGIREFISATNKKRFAWLIKPQHISKHREVSTISFMADCADIKRTTGWSGEYIILFVENKSVYQPEIIAGKPHINELKTKKKPMCFVQDLIRNTSREALKEIIIDAIAP